MRWLELQFGFDSTTMKVIKIMIWLQFDFDS